MRTPPTLPTDQLTVIPWPDDVIDAVGHEVRTPYVERYWLSVLGPSTTLLLRYIAHELERCPDGFTLDLAECAQRMGLAMKGGKGCPFMRALGRLVIFDLAQVHGAGVLAVRRHVPSLNRRHLMRLPATLQNEHHDWLDAQLRHAS